MNMRSSARPFLLGALAAAVALGCGDGPTDPLSFSLEGSWLGRGYPYELALDLDQDGENRVTGTGEIRGLTRRVLLVDTITVDPLDTDTAWDTLVAVRQPVRVRGDWGYPSFTLALGADGFGDAELAGTFAASDSIGSTLRGSGFPGVSIPLRRVPPPVEN